MKRCPECRRDYTDETLNFCLDDGTALVEGPASMEEPATAILHDTVSPKTGQTKAQLHVTDTDEAPPVPKEGRPRWSNSRPRALVTAIGFAVLLVGGFLAYRYVYPEARHIESIAVLPFVNAAGNPELEYLTDGMTESLMNDLSQLPNLSVKARSSVFRYKGKEIEPEQVASELNVQAVLNGRVIQRGDNLVISLDLVDGRSGNQIWGEQYSRRMGDLALLQTEIARAVSQKLRVRLSGAEEDRVLRHQTQNAEAYQLYLQGRYNWNQRTQPTTKKAIEYFQKAVEKDPNYALAYVGLAESYVLSDGPTDERYARVYAAAQRAIEIDPTLGEPYAALGNYYDVYKRDFAAAEDQFRKAIELNPNYATAYHWLAEMIVQTQKRFDDGLELYRKALELEPYSSAIATDYGLAIYYARRYDEAIDVLKRVSETDPSFVRTYSYLQTVYQTKGQYEDALAAAEKRVALQGESPEEIARGKREILNALKVGGPKGYWSKVIELTRRGSENGRPIPPSAIAVLYAQSGQKDEAFLWIDRAIDNYDTELFALNVSPEWDNLRDDPRFAEVLRRRGYTP